MDERGSGGYHRQLDPMEGEISVYHISLPAVPADALTDPFASCQPDCHWFKLVHTFDKQPNSQKKRRKKKKKKEKEGQDDSQCPSQLQHPSAQDQEVMSRLRLASLFAHFVSEQQTSGFSSRWTFSAEMMFNEGWDHQCRGWVIIIRLFRNKLKLKKKTVKKKKKKGGNLQLSLQ